MSRKSCTPTTVGSHAKYFVASCLRYAAWVASLTTGTFSEWMYCGYFDVSVCQPISSITNVRPFSVVGWPVPWNASHTDRKSTRLNSSHSSIAYADFCLKKKKTQPHTV